LVVSSWIRAARRCFVFGSRPPAWLGRELRLATRDDGLYLTTGGVLGISLERDQLAPFIQHACALVGLHIDGQLFG
jgi:hypothetical protein